MKRLSIALATSMLALTSWVTVAGADIRVPSSSTLNQTPIVRQAACNGHTGSRGCGPGFIWRCDRWGHHCRCRPC